VALLLVGTSIDFRADGSGSRRRFELAGHSVCCLTEHCAGLVNQLNKVRDGAPMGDAPEFVQAANMRDAFQQAG
jgi:hypothetical protein